MFERGNFPKYRIDFKKSITDRKLHYRDVIKATIYPDMSTGAGLTRGKLQGAANKL